jgi:hypothetical protein
LKTFHLATPWLGRHLRLEIISSFDTTRPTSPGSSAPSSRSVPLARGPVLNLSTPPPIRTIAVSSGCRPTQSSRHPVSLRILSTLLHPRHNDNHAVLLERILPDGYGDHYNDSSSSLVRLFAPQVA